ncbi:MAG: class II histone deacetylase [Roseovarius sp.]
MRHDKLDIFFHPDVLSMRTPDGLFDGAPSPLLEVQMTSVEGPDRIANIRSALERGPSADRFEWHTGWHATDDDILSFHTPGYLKSLKEADENGRWFNKSTFLPAGGLKGVRAGAGTILAALDHVLAEDGGIAYALVRPPTHHAAADMADGYCLLNGVAMAALRARAAGLARIAIVDWDVHHGNGTQDAFFDRDDVLFISMHMNHGSWSDETHPQTGEVDEIGRGAGRGYNLNLPVPFGAGDKVYDGLMTQVVLPALKAFAPDLIIVSNGQDASQFDPNGRNLLSMAGFHQLANRIADSAKELCDGRMLVVQEGGYNPAYTGLCAYATAVGFLGAPLDVPEPLAFYPENPDEVRRTISELIARHPLLDQTGQWSSTGG